MRSDFINHFVVLLAGPSCRVVRATAFMVVYEQLLLLFSRFFIFLRPSYITTRHYFTKHTHTHTHTSRKSFAHRHCTYYRSFGNPNVEKSTIKFARTHVHNGHIFFVGVNFIIEYDSGGDTARELN